MTDSAATVSAERICSLVSLPSGFRDVAVEEMETFIAHELAYRLRAFVYSQAAGPPVLEVLRYEKPRFPRWVPKWLRRRWVRVATLEVELEPLYLYPEATVPDLGAAVPHVKHRSVGRS